MAAAKKKTTSSRAKKGSKKTPAKKKTTTKKTSAKKKPTKKELTCADCGFVSKSKGGLTNHKKTHATKKKKTTPTKKKSSTKKRSAVKRSATIKRTPQTASRKKTYTTTVAQHKKTQRLEQSTQMTKIVDHVKAPEKKPSQWSMVHVAEVYLLLVIITVIIGSGSFMAMLVQGTLA